MVRGATMAPALSVGPSVPSVASVTNRVAGRARKANAAAKPTPDCVRPDGDQRLALPSFRRRRSAGERGWVAEGAYFPRECGQSIPADERDSSNMRGKCAIFARRHCGGNTSIAA